MKARQLRAVQMDGGGRSVASHVAERPNLGWAYGERLVLYDYEQGRRGENDDHPTAERTFTLRNKHGFHARAATRFVQLVNQYQSSVYVEKDGQRQDGRSVVGMLMLLAGKGSSITVQCRGRDADALLDAIAKLVEDAFGEQP